MSLIVRVNVVLNRTVVVDSDWRFDNLCGSHLQSQSELYHAPHIYLLTNNWWIYGVLSFVWFHDCQWTCLCDYLRSTFKYLSEFFLFIYLFIYFGHTNNYNTLHLQLITINSIYRLLLRILTSKPFCFAWLQYFSKCST